MSECCWIGCSKPAEFWVGKNDMTATHSCADHVDQLKADGDEVWPLDDDDGSASDDDPDATWPTEADLPPVDLGGEAGP